MRIAATAFVCVLLGGTVGAGQVPIDRAQQEAFLLHAEIFDRRPVGTGVTNSERVELRHEGAEHSAHLQTIDVERTGGSPGTDFRDSFRSNVAAYRLDQLLGQNLVPTSVIRELDGRLVAVTWWVDDVAMTERDRFVQAKEPPSAVTWNNQVSQANFFNALVYNTDSNLENLVIDSQWKLWMLDFTRAFQRREDLRRPDLVDRIDARVYDKLRTLTREELADGLEELIGGDGIDALIIRRDQLAALIDQRIEQYGSERILFHLSAP